MINYIEYQNYNFIANNINHHILVVVVHFFSTYNLLLVSAVTVMILYSSIFPSEYSLKANEVIIRY